VTSADPDDGSRARGFAAAGAIFAFVGVAAGAFGAHALRATLPPALLSAFETGVRYQLIHALALLACAWAIDRFASRAAVTAAVLFITGILLFSGSLYALALTGRSAFGIVTPFGGLALLAGWLVFAIGLLRR
jgi:uncharacterized membrane protein YgdD (TMEM256/DUF423 family)